MELISHHELEELGKGQKETPRVLAHPSILLAGIHLGWTRHAPPGRTLSQNDWLKTTWKLTPSPQNPAELFSWVPLPYCSPPGCPFPIKSLALSAHVSPQTTHFWELDKNLLSGPGRGPPSCNKTRRKEKRHRLDLFVFPSPPHLSPCRWAPSPPGSISVPDERNPDSLTQVRPPCQDPRSFSSPPAHRTLFSSVAQSCPTLCNLMEYSMPGFPVLHQLLELITLYWDNLFEVYLHCLPLSCVMPGRIWLQWPWPLTLGTTSTSVKPMNTGTSLGVQWLRLSSQFRGPRFDPWSEN